MSRIEFYKDALSKTKDQKNYLLSNSNLPGPRGNLELMQAFVEIGSEKDFIPLLDYTPDKAPVNSPEEFHTLRKGLGYCWSVAIAAYPEKGKPVFEKLLECNDRDIDWIIKENLKKNRLIKMDTNWVKDIVSKINQSA